MATIWIDHRNPPSLPSRCLRRGITTDLWVPTSASVPVGWRWGLLLLGPVGLLLLLLSSGSRASVVMDLPISREALRAVRLQRRVGLVMGVSGLALVLAGFGGVPQLWEGAAIGLVLVFVGFGIREVAATWHWVTPEIRAGVVVIRGVHHLVAGLIEEIPPTRVRTAGRM